MVHVAVSSKEAVVRPHTGAWIETVHVSYPANEDFGSPPHGGVD